MQNLKDSRRMQDPADGVVDRLRRREGLVATLVGDDPETSGEETDEEGVQSPVGEVEGGVEGGMGEVEGGGVDEGVGVHGGLVHGGDDYEVPDAASGLDRKLLGGKRAYM